jgi:predicted Fe-Mo cluster-binding NifX family protein
VKIAVVTDDQTTISQHFGRASFYLVLTVENGQIVQQELRPKLGHEQFRHEVHYHDDEHHHEHGHGYGQHSQDKHSSMMANLGDCQVLLCGGMGMGAYDSLQRMGITPVLTDIVAIETAVRSYVHGKLIDQPQRLH